MNYIFSFLRQTLNLILISIAHYTIIEWFRGIHWKIFCENLHYQPNGRRPRGWYCKFSQNLCQSIPRNHTIIIVLSHILLREGIVNKFYLLQELIIISLNNIYLLLKYNKLINRTLCLLPSANRYKYFRYHMFDVRIFLVYINATSNVTSEVDIDLERWILDIIQLKWSDVIGQIHLAMWQNTIIE